MEIDDLRVYELAMEMANKVWKIVLNWDFFAKDTVGKQLVRSVDSIAANLSEGYGRYHYRETIHFAYYSRGSLYETKTWIQKAFQRELINNTNYMWFMENIDVLGKMLNKYINSIGKNYPKP